MDVIQYSSIRSENGTITERAENAHDYGVTVACLRRDRVQEYNDRGLQSAPKEDIKIFYSFDFNSKNDTCYHSIESLPIDICLKIKSKVILALGCPVRVTRQVQAKCGDSCVTVPKNTFGTFVEATFDVNDFLKSSAKVQFRIKDKDWVADVTYAMEEFDLTCLDTIKFKSFFETFSRRHHMPLEVAHSVTMTSLQGREFDNLIYDMKAIGAWIRHAFYMGLTRVRSSKGIRLLNIPPAESDFNNTDKEIVELYKRLEAISERQMSSDSNRNEKLLTLDFVELLEKFKVF
jgi:hypothetical protein